MADKDRNIIEIKDFKEKAKKEETDNIEVRKRFNVEVKEVEGEERTIEVIASTPAKDRDLDTINQDGWILDDYKKNPIFLWAHDYSTLPLGKALATWVQDGQLRQKIQFAPAEANPMAEQVYQLYKGGFLNSVSVGFDPVEWEWAEGDEENINFQQQALLETSAVPVPSNPEALQVAGKEGVDTSVIKNWAKDVLDKTETEQATKAEDVELELEAKIKDNELKAECPHCEGKIYKEVKDGRVLSTRNKELLEEARDDVDKVLKECDDDDKEYIEQLEKEKEDLKEQVKQLKSEQSDYIELEEETLELADAAKDEKNDEIDIDADELSTLINDAVQEAVKNKTGKII